LRANKTYTKAFELDGACVEHRLGTPGDEGAIPGEGIHPQNGLEGGIQHNQTATGLYGESLRLGQCRTTPPRGIRDESAGPGLGVNTDHTGIAEARTFQGHQRPSSFDSNIQRLWG